ncbi:calcium-binding tyrosine phosphorylation-regulated protein-like isoform X2 [Acipenser ruthenus]|uniref:calcium-binding tyrosine phosphorylation-regulated protein-like isoform X2 n=1 Tax=Acipenser ruthenus TaxID=7906 RepID=UPI00274268E3|nr:calcium-binding tyrosine phosphorylation-regulated protein-like isoform X2 [Acipenser ruthenus]
MSSHHAKLVIPYGLKTLLEGVSRAVMKRQPENIPKFASCYFTELLKFRDENPSLDIMGLENEFRRIHDLGSSFEEHRLGVAAFHNDSPASEEQGTHSNTYTFESGIVRSPYSDQDPNTRCAVQSVFERVPSGIYEATSNSVLLKTPDVPHEDVITVHSENVPESLIFHKVKEESCTRQSLLGFDESTAKHKNAQDGESAPGKEYQAVVFQRVPSAIQLATPSAAQETVNQDTPVNAMEHSSAEAPSLHRKTSISGVEVPPEKAEIEQECVTAQQQIAVDLPTEAGRQPENPTQDDAEEVWMLYRLADFGTLGNMMQAHQYGSSMRPFVPEKLLSFHPMYQGIYPVQGVFPGAGFIPIQTFPTSQLSCPNLANILTQRRPSAPQFVLVNSPSEEQNMKLVAPPAGKTTKVPSQRPGTEKNNGTH